ncbi:unnamed protein product [Moneuplotes crassus]|uniref:Uncharacterized protein n=1 Tax=Euplotes crassus TaxID=5936 RepID=A0AAD1XSJ5_EUPCR|nr:unnamed protein product [Moneuplotes crassus]
MKAKESTKKACILDDNDLVHIQGFTFTKPNLYQFNPNSGDFIYGVGSNIVIYDSKNKKQVRFLKNSRGLPFSCFKFSPDGKDLYTGEYMAKEACIRHFSVSESEGLTSTSFSIKTKFRTIDGIEINSSQTHLLIYGSIKSTEKKETRKIEVYKIDTKKLLESHQTSYKVKCSTFIEDTFYISSKESVYQISSKSKWKPKMKKRFTADKRTIADMVVKESCLLTILDNGEIRIIDLAQTKSEEVIKLSIEDLTPVSMEICNGNLIIGCTNGAVYYLKNENFDTLIRLPNPPFLGENSSEIPQLKEFPDSRVVKAFKDKIAVLFNDKTMVWYQVCEDGEIKVFNIIKNHFEGVYSIDCYPSIHNDYQFAFLTGSVDRTLRRWIANIDQNDLSCQMNEDKVGLLCDNFNHLRSKSGAEEGGGIGKVRTISVSKNINLPHIVCGDSAGFMWIFNQADLSLDSLNEIHNSEILGIKYMEPKDCKDKRSCKVVTCAKDKKIKILDGQQVYDEIKSFEYHKSPVVGLEVLYDKRSDDLKIVSADTKGTIQTVSVDENLEVSKNKKKNLSSTKIYSMISKEDTIMIGTDNKLQVLTCREDRTVSLDHNVAPKSTLPKEYIKLETDEVSLYLVACSKKKRDINFIELKTGNVVHSFTCGEVITGIKYSPDYKFLITSTSTGCIYIWNVPSHIEAAIKFKRGQSSINLTENPIPGDERMRTGVQNSLDSYIDPNHTLKTTETGTTPEKERKVWGTFHNKSPKPKVPEIPSWAESTCRIDESEESKDAKRWQTDKKKSNDPFALLKQTVSGSEGDISDEEEKEIDILNEFLVNADHSETHSDVDNAFDFEKPEKTEERVDSKKLIISQSRIGDALRNSVFEREKKRKSALASLSQSTIDAPLKPLINTASIKGAIQEDSNEENDSTIQEINSIQNGKDKHSPKFKEVAKEGASNKTQKNIENELRENSSNVLNNPALETQALCTFAASKNLESSQEESKENPDDEIEIQKNLQVAFDSLQAASEHFNNAKSKKLKISQKTKDMMMMLSSSITSMQYAAFNAIVNHNED